MFNPMNAVLTENVYYQEFDGSESVCCAGTHVEIATLDPGIAWEPRTGKWSVEGATLAARYKNVWFELSPSQFALVG